MRVAVLLDDRCQPKKCNAECEAFCPPNRNGIECIVMNDGSGKPIISEPLCIGCGICINKCPFDALIITNLPQELESDMTHRYSENGFRLFRLPVPREEQVVGILGANGMGKSTAINLLSGTLRPNLGDWLAGEQPWEDVLEAFPRGELRDFMTSVSEEGVRIAVKPQYVDKIPRAFDGEVSALLERIDQRGVITEVSEALAIDHLFERKLPELSGGELQRV
nr:ATP-binding cassette domain-containing protein [Candidatus Poseidoniales archaeon]